MLNVATVQKHREPVQYGYMLQAAGHCARTGWPRRRPSRRQRLCLWECHGAGVVATTWRGRSDHRPPSAQAEVGGDKGLS